MRVTDISINRRLWLAVSLPLLAAFYLAATQLAATWSSYQDMERIVAVSGTVAGAGDLVHTLQVERGLSAGFIAAAGKDAGVDLAAARRGTDEALARFSAAVTGSALTANPRLRRQVEEVDASLSSLAASRAAIDRGAFTSAQSFDFYTGTVGRMTALAHELSMAGVSSSIATRIIAYNQLMQAKEVAGQERATGAGLIGAGRADEERLLAFAGMGGAQQALLDTFVGLQDAGERIDVGERIAVPAVEAVRGRIVGAGAGADLSGLDGKGWFAAATRRIDAMKALEDRSLQSIATLAEADAQGALSELWAIAALCVVGGALMIGLSSFMAMTIVRPLNWLVAAMRDLAGGDLAERDTGRSRKDEIGDMARAVEVFRLAAIRNGELEIEAEATRRRSEAERIETQRRAEADAEARLDRATGSLAAGLRQLAQGDLLCEIDEAFAPQFEALRHDFNASIGQLRQTLLGVGHSVHTVNGGAGEISSASDDLSRRTEQQAASLEQTAAALEQITANVTATSQRSAQASEVTRAAHVQAERSGEVVREAVAAMERIEQSSRQINQIIGVIDEIAFQTNLLALNAGVEAARAGEAGRGFAVVASEVRALAQRSAEAAREIKELIGNSTVAVTDGVRLVSDTGRGLGDIVRLVHQVNEQMEAIATAAREQSTGLAEVSTAVNHMDQATQQNAAMVEELSAAGAGLAQESQLLQAGLAGFHLQGAPARAFVHEEPQRLSA